LPGKSHGWRYLVGCSPWGFEESDTTKGLHLHFSLSCIREGNGNPLQCCCLENPRGGGAWWAAVYGVAQSQTQLKRLSSSSSNAHIVPLGIGLLPFLKKKKESSVYIYTHKDNISIPCITLNGKAPTKNAQNTFYEVAK